MPPPPTSLVDLPAPWLLKLASSDSFQGDNATLWRLSRTCTLFHDLVLQQRKAAASFRLPVAPGDFPRELRRLCTLARHSRNIELTFSRRQVGVSWIETEPHAAHLLLCAMAQLGGRPLTTVKAIRFDMELTSIDPVWLPLTCPNVTSLDCTFSTVTQHLPLPALPPRSSPTSTAPTPVVCQHLQHLGLPMRRWGTAQHLQQQLAALPNLSSLTLWDTEGVLQEVHTTSVTQLWLQAGFRAVGEAASTRILQQLTVPFPNLVKLVAPSRLTLYDGGLDVLLSVPSLRRVTVHVVRLERNHACRSCSWEQLSLVTLDVDSVARLPLEGIQRLCVEDGGKVRPSCDAQAVARVAAAIKRPGGLAWDGALNVSSEDAAALLITLHPLLEALPADQLGTITIADMPVDTPDVLQWLGYQLTPSVRTLCLHDCIWAPEAFPALLPSLPPTVLCVRLGWSEGTDAELTEECVLAICRAAVQHITLELGFRHLPEETLARIRTRLAQQGNTHVTLTKR